MKDDGNEKLTLGDWIAFLSSKSTSGINTIISLGAFVVAVYTGVWAVTKGSWISLVIVLGVYILTILVWRIIEWLKQNTAAATKLLNQIMEEDLRNPLEVERRWKEFRKKEKTEKNSKGDCEEEKVETKPS